MAISQPGPDLALTQVQGSMALTPQSVATVYSKWNTRDQMMQKKKPNMGKVMIHQTTAVKRSRNTVPSGSKGCEAAENILYGVVPKQGEGHDLGPGGTRGPQELRTFLDLAPLGRAKSQSRKNARGKEKQCRRSGEQREMGREPLGQAGSALRNPFGTYPLRRVRGRKVVISVPQKERTMPGSNIRTKVSAPDSLKLPSQGFLQAK